LRAISGGHDGVAGVDGLYGAGGLLGCAVFQEVAGADLYALEDVDVVGVDGEDEDALSWGGR